MAVGGKLPPPPPEVCLPGSPISWLGGGSALRGDGITRGRMFVLACLVLLSETVARGVLRLLECNDPKISDTVLVLKTIEENGTANSIDK